MKFFDPIACVFIRTLFWRAADCVGALGQRVYDRKKHHKLYGSLLIAALTYCLQNCGGTTHKTLPAT